MTWNPSDYGGLDVIIVSSNEIWTPDLTVWNNADNANMMESIGTHNARLNASGIIEWWPGITFSTYCQVDLKDFPFDTQSCEIWLGSWSMDSTQINFTKHGNIYKVNSVKLLLICSI